MRVEKDFRFDAAHRIVGHRGRCGWLHGHAYRLRVTVAAAELDRLDMVMDFDDLAAVVRAAVLDRWDHATLLHADDPLVRAIAAVQADAPERLVLFSGNPTAELLAREAFGAIGKRLPERVRLACVSVWETPTSGSEYRGDDDG